MIFSNYNVDLITEDSFLKFMDFNSKGNIYIALRTKKRKEKRKKKTALESMGFITLFTLL